MKKIFSLIQSVLIFGCIWINSSCSEDFLTKAPPATLLPPLLEDMRGVEALLTGTYSMLTGGDIFGAAMATDWIYGSCAADDAYKGSEEGDQSQFNQVERYAALTDNPYMTARWSYCYDGVARANATLEYMTRVPPLTNPTDVARMKVIEAEAKYLRAWFHFSLNRVFKNIAYIRTPDEQGGKLAIEIPNKDAGWTEMEKDLDDAIANLPASWNAANVGRATSWAAKTMKAQAFMYQNKLSQAKPLLDDILTNGPFALVDNFFDNYDERTENNKESIFEIQCSSSGTGNIALDLTGAVGIQPTGPAAFGWGFYQPSQCLVDAFGVDNGGLPFLDITTRPTVKNDMRIQSSAAFTPTDAPLDLRLDWTVARRGVDYLGWGIFPGAGWVRNHANGGPYMTKKYIHFYETRGQQAGSGFRNNRNFRYHRLAHVILWRAEIAVEENDLTYALKLVNDIRNRVKTSKPVMGLVTATTLATTGVVPAEQIDWTKPAANYKTEPYPSFPNQEYAREAVRMELRLEFATEGQRFFDLRRWGIDVEVLNDYIDRDTKFRDFMTGAVYSAKRRYWPVPQLQTEIQQGVITQDPDYLN